jgi:hypothetical protein
VPIIHGLIVLDIANASKPVEVSRLKIDDVIATHWTSWDAKAQRQWPHGWKGSANPHGVVFSR